MSTCSVAGCENEANVSGAARGWCRAHYKRWHKYGDVNFEPKRVRSWRGAVCSKDGCERQVRRNGLCDTHSAVAKRRADPEIERRQWARSKERYRARQEDRMGRPRPERCELCNEPPGPGYAGICFDHDHATGKPRGWLCDRCNKVLGLVKDDPALLRSLAGYLEVHHGEAHRSQTEEDAEVLVRGAREEFSGVG